MRRPRAVGFAYRFCSCSWETRTKIIHISKCDYFRPACPNRKGTPLPMAECYLEVEGSPALEVDYDEKETLIMLAEDGLEEDATDDTCVVSMILFNIVAHPPMSTLSKGRSLGFGGLG